MNLLVPVTYLLWTLLPHLPQRFESKSLNSIFDFFIVANFLTNPMQGGGKPATINGKQVLGDLQLDSRHIPMVRLPKLIDFRDIFSEYGGYEQLAVLIFPYL